MPAWIFQNTEQDSHSSASKSVFPSEVNISERFGGGASPLAARAGEQEHAFEGAAAREQGKHSLSPLASGRKAETAARQITGAQAESDKNDA